jgi:hypothetical protein
MIRITPEELERARLCVRAATMRAAAVPYADIARELGLESAMAAKRCAEVGFEMAPAEDLRVARERAAAQLEAFRKKLFGPDDDDGLAGIPAIPVAPPHSPQTGASVPLPPIA